MKSINLLLSFFRPTLRLVIISPRRSFERETYWLARAILVAKGLVEDSPFVPLFDEATRIEGASVSS
jgi:hypothetical protein